ncbi:hypothetical protein [Orrella marina]|nr:hypothetical protein [Orrella marina]
MIGGLFVPAWLLDLSMDERALTGLVGMSFPFVERMPPSDSLRIDLSSA